jgi:signal transduction histidine kinase
MIIACYNKHSLAVKKFTYMGSVAEREFEDVDPGIHDTINVLIAKIKSKNADIILEFTRNLLLVYANGSDFNQVWFRIINNAPNAIPKSGKILFYRIKVSLRE